MQNRGRGHLHGASEDFAALGVLEGQYGSPFAERRRGDRPGGKRLIGNSDLGFEQRVALADHATDQLPTLLDQLGVQRRRVYAPGGDIFGQLHRGADQIAFACQRYPAVITLWDNAWSEFIPFLDYDAEIPPGDLFHQRDRVAQRPLPVGDQGSRPLPLRAGRAEMFVPGDPIAGPDRRWQGTMDDAVETRAECVRDHLPGPIPRSRNLLMETAGNTVNEIVRVGTTSVSQIIRGAG